MSLTVISPSSRPSRPTTGSFSMRWRCRISCASSRVVPTGAVTSLSEVISADTGRSRSISNCRSRLVMIPTSVPSGRTIGTPLIEKRDMRACASLSEASGPRVIGFMIMPLSERFTRSTSCTWRSTGMFLWITPTPPSRATAIAISASVTVSIAADTKGTESSIRFVSRVVTSVSLGCTRECPGTRRTSSKVRASLMIFSPWANWSSRVYGLPKWR